MELECLDCKASYPFYILPCAYLLSVIMANKIKKILPGPSILFMKSAHFIFCDEYI